MPRPGPLNLITDVPGLLVGNVTDERVQSGVTTLICPGGWRAGVDVRGGGPGVRETETLSPENSNALAHAIVLSGGSAFGLAAADGVTAALSERGEGVVIRPGLRPVPIVPSAILFDLGNGGDKAWGAEPPYRALGAASVEAVATAFALGSVGAGRGAMAGTHEGGLGSASLDLGEGLMVGALVAVNPVGSVYMADGETLWAWPFEIDGEFGGGRPVQAEAEIDPFPAHSRLAGLGRLSQGANTTIAVVAVSGDLTSAECKRVAMMAQDGLARAIRPAHTPFDGDTVFAVAGTQTALGPDPERRIKVALLGSAAADCLARAIARGVYEAGRAGVASS